MPSASILAYSHHGGDGVVLWLAHLIVRAAVYRVFFGLPGWAAFLLGFAALALVVRARRGIHARAGRRA